MAASNVHVQNRAVSADLGNAGHITTFPLNRGYHALVDVEDLDRLSQYKWLVKVKEDGRMYAQTNIRLADGRKTTMLMHRFILNAERGQQIDHEDNNGLHNWKDNLRFCTLSQNAQNSKGKTKRLTAKYKGVWKVKGRHH